MTLIKGFLKKYYPIIITAIFFLLALFNVLHHEMWRDEMQAWLIARDSRSLLELFKAVRYEGQPGLWHLILFILTRFTTNPLLMQLSHISLATIGVYLFCRFSPFNIINKILFSFGYFTFFEYATISRNYVLGVLFLIIFCIFYARQPRNFLFLSISLFLLSLTSVYGLIIASVLGLLVGKKIFYDRDKNQIQSREKVISTLIIISGILIALLSFILSPKDSNFLPSWNLYFDPTILKNSIATFFKTLIPIPNNLPHFWGTNILDGHSLRLTFLSSILFILFVLILSRRKEALFVFVAGTMGLIFFNYLKFLGYIRQWGYIFLILIAALWIAEYEKPYLLKNNFFNVLTQKIYDARIYLLTLILLVHFVMGIMANSLDYLYPFSASKETSAYIRQNFEGYLYAGHLDILVSPLPGYLNKKIYYFTSNDFGSYIVWSSKIRKYFPSSEEIIEQAQFLNQDNNQKILLILSYALPQELLDKYNLNLKYYSEDSIVGDEKYYLYTF